MKLYVDNFKKAFEYIFECVTKHKNIVLCGGSTIKKLLKHLNNSKNFKQNTILLSDERLVPIRSNLRNDKFYLSKLSKKYFNKSKFIHFKASDKSEKELNTLRKKIKKINFNICILSLGVNGHVAGIFNYNDNQTDDYYFTKSYKKKPKNRVTISLNKISKSDLIIILVDIKKKKKDLKAFEKKTFYKTNKKKIRLIIIKNYNLE